MAILSNYHLYTENRKFNFSIDKFKNFRNATTVDLLEYYQIYQHNEIPDLFIFMKQTITIDIGDGKSLLKSLEIIEGNPARMLFYFWDHIRMKKATLLELDIPVWRCGPDYDLQVDTDFSNGESMGHYCMEKIRDRLGLSDIDIRFETYIPEKITVEAK